MSFLYIIAIGQKCFRKITLKSESEEDLEFDWDNEEEIIYVDKYILFSLWIWIYMVCVCMCFYRKYMLCVYVCMNLYVYVFYDYW